MMILQYRGFTALTQALPSTPRTVTTRTQRITEPTGLNMCCNSISLTNQIVSYLFKRERSHIRFSKYTNWDVTGVTGNNV